METRFEFRNDPLFSLSGAWWCGEEEDEGGLQLEMSMKGLECHSRGLDLPSF